MNSQSSFMLTLHKKVQGDWMNSQSSFMLTLHKKVQGDWMRVIK